MQGRPRQCFKRWLEKLTCFGSILYGIVLNGCNIGLCTIRFWLLCTRDLSASSLNVDLKKSQTRLQKVQVDLRLLLWRLKLRQWRRQMLRRFAICDRVMRWIYVNFVMRRICWLLRSASWQWKRRRICQLKNWGITGGVQEKVGVKCNGGRG